MPSYAAKSSSRISGTTVRYGAAARITGKTEICGPDPASAPAVPPICQTTVPTSPATRISTPSSTALSSATASASTTNGAPQRKLPGTWPCATTLTSTASSTTKTSPYVELMTSRMPGS